MRFEVCQAAWRALLIAAALTRAGSFRTGPRPRLLSKGLIERFKFVTQTLLCVAALPGVPEAISQQHQHPLGRDRGKSFLLGYQNHMIRTLFERERGVRERESEWNSPMSLEYLLCPARVEKDGYWVTALPVMRSLFSSSHRRFSSQTVQCLSRWDKCGILVPRGPI